MRKCVILCKNCHAELHDGLGLAILPKEEIPKYPIEDIFEKFEVGRLVGMNGIRFDDLSVAERIRLQLDG